MAPNSQVTLDSLLEDIGYQVWNYLILGLPILLVSAFSLTYIFTTAELKYRCLVPECENLQNTTYITPWLPNAVPYKDGVPETCKRYAVIAGTSGCNQPSHFNQSNVISCQSWVYETDEVNILNEFNLQCDENKWKLAFVGSFNGFGSVVGFFLCGIVSDKFGRRIALSAFSSMVIILGVIRSFSTSYEQFAFLDFLNTVLDSGIYSSAYILGMEIVSNRHRVSASVILNLFFPIGNIILGVLGMYIHNWRWFLRCLYLPGMIFFFYFWLVPESMRWLMSKNRKDEATKVVRKFLKDHPNIDILDIEGILDSTEILAPKKEEYGYFKTFHMVLKSWRLLMRLVHSSCIWIGIAFLWYAILQETVILSGNKYLNFIYSALAQIPGYLITASSLKVGHKVTLFSSIILCSTVSFLFYFTSQAHTTTRLALFLLGNIGITSSFTVLYMVTCEMFPTPLRHSLLAICYTVGGVGRILAPQVYLLGTEIPFLIFGSVALVVGILSIFLPETANLELPNTVKESEYVGFKGAEDHAHYT